MSAAVTTSASQPTGAHKVKVLPDEYKEAVTFYARQENTQTLYPGHLFEDLADFLQRPPIPPRGIQTKLNSHVAFSTLYTLDGLDSRSIGVFNDVESCVQQVAQNLENSQPQILFLKGYPSPEWLLSIGALLRVDPEFFKWQLRFRCRRTDFASPSLPSTFDNIIKLRFITIGSREEREGKSDQPSVDSLRSKGTRAFHQYEHELTASNEIRRGDSIVRGFSVLDERHFLIEQEMSICLNFVGKTWAAIICTDAGNDLSQGPQGPWLSTRDRNASSPWTMFYLTTQHRRRVAFKSKALLSEDADHGRQRFFQSASLLSEGYGRFLDRQAMKADPFYALDDLFKFSAFQYQQFLNMMEEKMGPETGHSSLDQEQPTLSNLLYFQDILDLHVVLLEENIKVIKRRGGSKWPRIPEQCQHQHSKAESAAGFLSDDFEYLLKRAILLSERCTRGTSIMMNNAMLAESKRAIRQAKWVAKLTLIAFFYIPLSFTTSFYGMNVQELDSGRLPIWTWFVFTVPIFALSIIFLFGDAQSFLRLGKRIKLWLVDLFS